MENCIIQAFPPSVDGTSVLGTGTPAKLETKLSIKTLSAVVLQTVILVAASGWRRSQRGGVREPCLHNNFFSIYYSTPSLSWDEIAVAIF